MDIIPQHGPAVIYQHPRSPVTFDTPFSAEFPQMPHPTRKPQPATIRLAPAPVVSRADATRAIADEQACADAREARDDAKKQLMLMVERHGYSTVQTWLRNLGRVLGGDQ
jgi:hypothetical protein